MLSSVGLAGGTAATDLLIAVAMLRELNATGCRKVFDEAPTGFVPTRWRGYLKEARKFGNPTAYRPYWELCVLLGLRDGLRTVDVSVPGSRRYADPAEYLLTPEQWEPQRAEFCRLVGKSADPTRALADAVDDLHESVAELTAATLHNWRRQSGGVDTDAAKRGLDMLKDVLSMPERFACKIVGRIARHTGRADPGRSRRRSSGLAAFLCHETSALGLRLELRVRRSSTEELPVRGDYRRSMMVALARPPASHMVWRA